MTIKSTGIPPLYKFQSIHFGIPSTIFRDLFAQSFLSIQIVKFATKMCECPALQQQQEQQIQPVIQANNKKLSSASSMESNSFPLFQAIKLICIGCCLTTITNFPSAFMVNSDLGSTLKIT
jgi:hypothetical protein